MKTCIPLKRAIQSMIVFLMLLAIAIVWPLKIIRPNYYEGELDKESYNLVQNDGTIMQEFTVVRPELTTISFYLYNEDALEMEDGKLIYRLFDDKLVKIDEKQFQVEDLKLPGICEIKVRGQLEAGKQYFFSLENPNANLIYAMSDGVNLDARYEYRSYFSKGQYAVYALLAFLVGGILLVAVEKIPQKKEQIVRADFGVRLGSSILLAGGALWLAWNVFPLQKFTTDWVNILFYETGIFLFLAILLYGLLHRRETPAVSEISWKEIAGKIPTLLQIWAFAGVMGGCIEYVNALYTYYQEKAVRTTLIYFALAIIFSFRKKEILNWYNPVYLLCAVGGSIYYCLQNNADVQTFALARGTAVAATLWGFVVLNVIRILILYKQYQSQKISKIYTIAMVLLLAEMIRSRNTRIWPIEIAFFFGLLAVRMVGTGKITQFLDNFVNGVFVNFLGVSIYALLYRPFHAYHYTRYATVFHTVTVAAVYDVMVLSMALVRFLAVYNQKKSLKAAWKEWCLMGLAGAYVFLTLSRTAYLTIIIAGIFIFAMTDFFEYKDGMKALLKRIGIFFASGIIGFVIAFSGARLVPAVVSQPYTYDVEWFIASIERGEEWDSSFYVTLQRFVQIAVDKLGIMSEAEWEEFIREGESETEEDVGQGQLQEQVNVENTDISEKIEEFSNGRMQIFKDYLANLNWKGHKTVAVLDEAGNAMHMHAHNSYIQTAHNFGIGAGILFLLFCIYAGIRSIGYYFKHRGEINCLMPVSVIGAFGVSSMVERVFHPYIPLGFAFLFIWVVLIPEDEGKGGLQKVWKRHEKNN